MAVPILVYDGDCAFCTRSAKWIAARWTRPANVIAWQQLGNGQLGAWGLTERDVTTAAYWVDGSGHTHRGYRAVARALLAGTRRDRWLGRTLLFPPVSWLAWLGYGWVARNRSRLPGGTPACSTQDRGPGDRAPGDRAPGDRAPQGRP